MNTKKDKIRRGYKIKFPNNHIEYITDTRWFHWKENGRKYKRRIICTNEWFDINISDKEIIKNFK